MLQGWRVMHDGSWRNQPPFCKAPGGMLVFQRRLYL
jgi:hypothetical protein